MKTIAAVVNTATRPAVSNSSSTIRSRFFRYRIDENAPFDANAFAWVMWEYPSCPSWSFPAAPDSNRDQSLPSIDSSCSIVTPTLGTPPNTDPSLRSLKCFSASWYAEAGSGT